MSIALITLLAVFLILLLLGLPIALGIGVASIAALLAKGTLPLIVVPQRLAVAIDSFPLLAVPFFILAGDIMLFGGISKRLVTLAKMLVGWSRSGLAYVTVVASAFFGAISGSAAATTAAIGGMMYPEMTRAKYKEGFASFLGAIAGTLGLLIPPSILMVLYGVATNTSVGDMLLSGILPGILLGVLVACAAIFVCVRCGYRGEGRLSLSEIVSSFFRAFFALLTPVIILGGIYTGVCTATEAAAVAALYSLFAGIFIYRELTLAKILNISYRSIKLAGGILLIVAATQAFGWVLTRERIPQLLAHFFSQLSSNPVVFMLAVCVLLLIAGCFLDAVPAIMIFAPILTPSALQYNIDPVHFGVVMVVALCIGLITPPVGMNLFVVSSLTKRPVHAIVKKSTPFLVAVLVGLLLVVFVPKLSLLLPAALG